PSPLLSASFFLYCSVVYCDLHSFPTRRSSDLFLATVPALVIGSLFSLLYSEPLFQIIEEDNHGCFQLLLRDSALQSSLTSSVWHMLQFALSSRNTSALK